MIEEGQLVETPNDEVDRDKLVRIFFAIMALHEHTFKVKDVSPNYIANQYKAFLTELDDVIPADLATEAKRLFHFDDPDINLSTLQTEAASMLGWMNGMLITSGVAQVGSAGRTSTGLPQQLMSQESQGQYL